MPLLALMLATPSVASTPSAWAAMHKSAQAACIKASGLISARASAPLDFSDDSARSLLLVTGLWPQRHLKGRSATMACLYDRRTRRAETVEALGWSARP